jgi:hypothetical protein
LDLTYKSGVTCRVDDAALLAAAARAQGRLEALSVSGRLLGHAVLRDVLRDVLAANVATLRELRKLRISDFEVDRTGRSPWVQEVQALAPALECLEAEMTCDCLGARSMLRNEPPFGPLRMHSMSVMCTSGADFRAMAAELTSHRSLTKLCVFVQVGTLSTDELGLVVDAALAVRFKKLELSDCGLTPAAAPALDRLLSSPALTHLRIANDEDGCKTLLDATGYALLGDALRSNRTLRKLVLYGVVWLDVAAEVPALFGALTGHASLRCLECSYNLMGAPVVGDIEPLVGEELEAATAVFGHAIGALVAADAPALEELAISFYESGTDVLGPLFDALPHNTHLRMLALLRPDLSAVFAEQRLLPALRANASLRQLYISPGELDGYHDSPDPEVDVAVEEALQLIRLREAARVAAEAAAGNA